MKKCKYSRDSANETYIPACCDDPEDGACMDAHPMDVEEWTFCPFCGKKIKLCD